MQRSLLYIVNPISGTGNKGSIAELIRTRTERAGLPYEITASSKTADYRPLIPLIREKGITDVIVAGGDGTVNQVIGGLKGEAVRFGILPCGSGNGLAFGAGIPKSHEKALDVVLAGKGDWTDAFRINGQFACMLCGLGFDGQVAHDFANDPKRGLSTYIKKVLQNFFSAKSYPFRIEADGKKLDVDAFLVSIANSNQFGNNFTIAPKASLTDGLLDVVIVTRQSKVKMVLETLKQVVGFNKMEQLEELTGSKGVIYFQASRISLTNEGGAAMHVDGDPVDTASAVEVEVLNRSFQLIYP